MRFAVLRPVMVCAVAAAAAIASKIRARRRAANVRVSGGHKSLMMNLLDRATSERARASVTRALRQALARIREYDPLLGKHLDRTVSTGTYCAYKPDPPAPVVWDRASPPDRAP